MSTLNMCSPPQTYSRLFRPWDSNIENNQIKIESSTSEQSEEHVQTDSEDNECSSSNISADSNTNPIFDDCESDTPTYGTITTTRNNDALMTSGSYNTNEQFYQSPTESQLHASHHLSQSHQHQHYQQLTMFSGIPPAGAEVNASNNFYYAAAAAAAAAGSLNMTSMPGLAPTFSIDPSYPLGLMEQEYARIMAEEAHLKALNARKQRPKKFKCPHCDVAFSNNGQLKGHIRIHTGERPFKCDAEGCGKTFTRNEELTRHKRIHTGLRPFPCPACGKKFGRRDHLKKHMKTHMPQEHPLGNSAAFFVPMYPYMYGL